MSYNRIIIIGNVGKDVDYRDSGACEFVQFSVATNEKYQKDGDWVTSTQWHKVVAFRKTAEVARDRIRKGVQVLVEGKVQYRKWEKDGVTRYYTQILADKIMVMDKAVGDESLDETDIPDVVANSFTGGEDIPF